MTSTLTPVQWFPINGLDLQSAPHDVRLDMASDGNDFISDFGKITKRPGTVTANSTDISATPTVNSLASLYLSNGTKYEIVGTDDGIIYNDQNGTISASFLSGFSTTQPADFTQFLDKTIIMDGALTARTWTGGATGYISAAPLGRYGEEHLNKLFITGITSARSRIDYSATGDVDTWSGTGTDKIQVSQNDGQVITGLKSFQRNELIIFKERSMFKLTGFTTTSFNLISVDKSIGCIDNRTIQNFRGGLLIWASDDGIYMYDGSRPQKISYYIQTLWDSINRSKYSIYASTIDLDNSRYLLSFTTGSSTTNNITIAIDLLRPFQDEKGLHYPVFEWTVGCQSLNTERDSNGDQRIVFGGSADGKKNYFGETTRSDNGTSIDVDIVSPLFQGTDPFSVSQALRRFYANFKETAGDVLVYSEILDGTDWLLVDTISSGTDADAIGIDFTIGISAIGVPNTTFTHRVDTQIRSRRMKIRFNQDSASRYFTMQPPIELWFKSGGQRS